MATVSNSVRPLLRLRAAHSCLSRRCASSATVSARSSLKQTNTVSQPPVSKSSRPKPQVSLQPPKAPRSSIPVLDATESRLNDLPPELARKQWYAQKLYDSGQTAIYRPPSHFGIYAASWIMGGSAVTIAGFLAYANLWAWEGDTGLHWIVPTAHRCGIIVFSAIGWLIIMRSLRIIKSIDLVSMDGMVKMAVQVRRPLPFLRPKVYMIAPYHFQMDQKFVTQMEYPEFMRDDEEMPESETPPSRSLLARVGRSISQAVYYPFASTRRLMTLEGFMWVSFEGASGKMKLDTQGLFSNGAKDLIEMGTIQR
ncbi:hypothetical protein G647_04938 [Cladophialophora carrionii CBS 160.54]|uniref:Uncharacterized protein n=1 Tax=Cladophialophora carrionii CBS 160.54 TaxID=1279043 RepID=V9D8Y6_9EURO|nr:uncharacterized protein G647_04938 [Cladophialophora carrionii CBS 160.54]ETI23141.1 hypothetical protein G647_04938 [Cladophialophora carrionii CBS 160.54]